MAKIKLKEHKNWALCRLIKKDIKISRMLITNTFFLIPNTIFFPHGTLFFLNLTPNDNFLGKKEKK